MFPSISFKLQCWLDGAIATAGANFFGWRFWLGEALACNQAIAKSNRVCIPNYLSQVKKLPIPIGYLLLVGGLTPHPVFFSEYTEPNTHIGKERILFPYLPHLFHLPSSGAFINWLIRVRGRSVLTRCGCWCRFC